MPDLKGSTATLATMPLDGAELLLASDGGLDRSITTRMLASYIGDSVQNQYFGTAQAIGASTTAYLSGSDLTIPTGERVTNKTWARWKLQMHKTGAGTVACSFLVKWGTAGTTADATIATLTLPTQTGVIDEADFEIVVGFRSVGAGTSAVVVAELRMRHNLASTGWATIATVVLAAVTSSGFNSDVNLSKLGLAFTTGASYSITMTSMTAEAKNV